MNHTLSLSTAQAMEGVSEFVKKLGYLIYIVDPRENIFQHTSQVPDYYTEIIPIFIFMIIAEQFAILVTRKTLPRLNDSVANICQGMLFELFKIPLHGVELIIYTWVYEQYRLTQLPWDSTWTWIVCLVGTDFAFYWMHRATHQISILWTFHEPHHSSEEFNLMVPFRLSILQSCTFWLTYVPMALAIPPSIFFVHYQLNIIYQYWLHTELVPKLGPIEWVFTTPTHHRIHHGRNRRCIDKNFGGFLIIWDRIFGSFEEDKDEDIKFGLVHPLKTFNPISIQTNNLRNIWRRLQTAQSCTEKLGIIFKGPGWSPGKPWLGEINDIPEPSKDEEKYDPPLALWMKVYTCVHMTAVLAGFLPLVLNAKVLPVDVLAWSSLHILWSIYAFGVILDGSRMTGFVEIVRCVLYFAVDAVVGERISSIHLIVRLLIRMYRYLYFITFLLWFSVFPHTTVILSWNKEK